MIKQIESRSFNKLNKEQCFNYYILSASYILILYKYIDYGINPLINDFYI